jgi:hypothetical protein
MWRDGIFEIKYNGTEEITKFSMTYLGYKEFSMAQKELTLKKVHPSRLDVDTDRPFVGSSAASRFLGLPQRSNHVVHGVLNCWFVQSGNISACFSFFIVAKFIQHVLFSKLISLHVLFKTNIYHTFSIT